jgi:molybdopterin biosynthesis enzyme
MTRSELVQMTRETLRDAFGSLASDDLRYDLSVAECNEAMMDGVALAAADFVMAAAGPTPVNKRFIADHVARRIISTVEALQTEGSA